MCSVSDSECYVLRALREIGGVATSYQITRHVLNREREHPSTGQDYEFINTQDDVRTRLRRARHTHRLTRSRLPGPAASYLWTLHDASALPASGERDPVVSG